MKSRNPAIAVFAIAALLIVIMVYRNHRKEENKVNTSATISTQIQYEQVDLQVMLDELNTNALRAEETYQDKYIEITGEIISFDSDGKYISIVPCGGSVLSEWVHCSVDKTHKAFLLEKNEGDVVTIRGKVVSIGEIQGYSVKIAEISD